jgi:hypothetical protein
MGSISRRDVLVGGTAGVSGVLAGCLSRTGGDDGVSGSVENRTDSERSVAIELIRPDGAVDFGREYDLRPTDSVAFSVAEPAPEYTLRTAIRGGGGSKTETWTTGACRRVTITLRGTGIDYTFGDC